MIWFITSADNARLAAWIVAFAMGLRATIGKSHAEVAASCGVTRAAISKGVLEFQRANGILPMPGQKVEASQQSKRDNRRKQLCTNN